MNFDIKIQPIVLPNLFPIMLDLPPPVVDYLNGLADDVMSSPDKFVPHNANLAGHLSGEYWLDFNDEFRDLLTGIGQEFYRVNGLPPKTLKLTSSWINFQRKHEFNPTHNHDGHLSFVIWLRIPYRLEDEINIFPQARGQRTSKFEFAYNSILGQPCTRELDVDQNWQGRMCVFPSPLPHAVYPFYTSDGVRISISGNLA